MRTDIDDPLRRWPTRSARARSFRTRQPRDVFDELRAGDARRRRRTTPASPTSGSTRRTACSGRARRHDHPGTPRLFADGFPTPTRPGAVSRASHTEPAEAPRRRVSRCYLTTGRVLAHYQSGTQTRRVAELQAIAPEPLAEMHPATAQLLGVADGDARAR